MDPFSFFQSKTVCVSRYTTTPLFFIYSPIYISLCFFAFLGGVGENDQRMNGLRDPTFSRKTRPEVIGEILNIERNNIAFFSREPNRNLYTIYIIEYILYNRSTII